MSTPDELITDARNYAVNVTTAGVAALNTAMATVDRIGQGYLAGSSPEVNVNPPTPGDPGEAPVYNGIRITMREFTGTAPRLDNVGTMTLPPGPGSAPSIPDFVDPVQVKPTGNADPSLIGSAPLINPNVTFPDAPIIDVAGIPKPVLTDLVIPDAPIYQPPEFLGERPSFTAEVPTDLDVLMRQQYATISPVMRDAVTAQIESFLDAYFPEFHPALAALEAKLTTYMNGGTALTPAIENAIYNRTLDKTNTDANRATDAAWQKAARAGFTVPTAVLLSQTALIDQERRNNNARAATEIAIKQAELEQNNIQFAITQSASLRQVAMSAALSYYSGLVTINGQALEYARGVVDSVVKSFDIAAKYAEIQARIYDSDARVYEARLRGALASIEVYQAQIRAIQAQVEVDTAKVNAYRALLDATKAEADVYRTQVDAARTQIDIERAKVDLYSARVNAFVAQVNGYTAQWQGYAAAVSGERAKIEAAGEQVKAYSARVNAYEAEVRAKGIEIESKAQANTQRLLAYKTEVDAYAALVNAESQTLAAEINSYESTIQAYMAKSRAISDKSQSEIAIYRVAQEGIQNAAQLQFEFMRHNGQMDVARARAAGEIANSIGEVYARTTQAALSGMNSLAASTTTATA